MSDSESNHSDDNASASEHSENFDSPEEHAESHSDDSPKPTEDNAPEPARKRGRSRVSQFIEDEVHVDDEDESNNSEEFEEEEEENEEDKRFIDTESENEEQDSILQHIRHDDAKSRSRKSKDKTKHHMSEEAIAAREQANSYQGSDYVQRERVIYKDTTNAYKIPINQYRSLIEPTAGTNRLFIVKCKNGKEFEVITKIADKMLFTDYGANIRSVFSAFCPNIGSGVIYIEALTQKVVIDIVSKIFNVHNSYAPKVLPFAQMRQAITVPHRVSDLKPGIFIEIRRNSSKNENFKGDIGQVVDIDVNNNHAMVKLVPRIDYTLLRDYKTREDNAETSDIIDGRQSQLNRLKGSDYKPPQAEFNQESIVQAGGKVDEKRMRLHDKTVINEQCYYWDDRLFIATFMYHTYPFDYLKIPDHSISSDVYNKFYDGLNLTKFEKNIAGFELSMNSSLYRGKSSSFRPGDLAKVLPPNEFEGLEVKIITIDQSVAKVTAFDGSKEIELSVETSSLEKYFNIGDQVKVIDGPNINETGHVISVSNRDVHILTDSNQVEIISRVDCLIRSSEFNTGRETFGVYRLGDLIQTTDNNIGMIVKIESTFASVLLTTGQLQSFNETQISKSMRDGGTRDKNGNPIDVGTAVSTFYKGHNVSRATVKHIRHPHVFCHSDDVVDNKGVFVAQNNSCTSLVAQKQGMAQVEGNFITHRAQFRTDLQGKTVRILNGPNRGLLADVKIATQDKMKCVLQTNGKEVALPTIGENVSWKQIEDVDKHGASRDPFNIIFRHATPLIQKAESEERRGEFAAPSYGTSTFAQGSPLGPSPYQPASPYGPSQYPQGNAFQQGSPYVQTPSYGTPEYGQPYAYGDQRTPQFQADSRTPPYGGDQRSPQYPPDSRTPPYGGDQRSPQYSGDSRTPPYGGDQRSPQYPADSRTPPYGSGDQRTPQYGGNYADQQYQYPGDQRSPAYQNYPPPPN